MVKQNLIIMKQPELGKKILELRKAKGLTQEELVALCNINVRTIQRIEAGEVTPRSYTIKAILEVLEFDFDQIQQDNMENRDMPDIMKYRKFLKSAFVVGIVYFLLTFIEMPMDFMILESGPASVQSFWYIAVKIAVIFTFSMFILGYYRLSVLVPNFIIRAASILLIIGILVSNVADITAYLLPGISFEMLQFSKPILFGALYLVFGIGMIRYREVYGSMALWLGVLAVISGLMFISVILALPGLFVFTFFEILQLVFLYQASANLQREKTYHFAESIH